jgi:hypothetical protein
VVLHAMLRTSSPWSGGARRQSKRARGKQIHPYLPIEARWLGIGALLIGGILWWSLEQLTPLPGTHAINGYRPDEVALMELTTQNILDLQKAGAFTTIYRKYASPSFQQHIRLDQFQQLSDCVVNHLGPTQSANIGTMQIQHITTNGAHHGYELVKLRVNHASGPVEVEIGYVRDGLDYRIQRWDWLSRNAEFHNCIKTALIPGATP